LVEATTDLDAAKIAVAEAYSASNNAFPLTANAPISTTVNTNAKYGTGVNYNAAAAAGPASVVLTLGATGNTNVDGKFLGIIGVGNADGTVTWTCATVAGATGTAVGAVTAMYPYLPAPCQN